VSAEATIEEIINEARAFANDYGEAAIDLANEAQTAALSIVTLSPPPAIQQPDVDGPPLPPNGDAALEFKSSFNELFNQLGPEFDARLTALVERFFPEIDDCLPDTIDNWICDTIRNGGTGIPAAVEDQIWERSRAREALDAQRQTDEVIEQFAGRGFALPSGGLFNATARIQDALSQKVSTHSREVAIKQVEIEIQNIRFAVEQGIRLRLGAIDATVNYLRAWLGIVKESVDYGSAVTSARLKLYDSSSDYYRALVAGEALTLDWSKSTNASFLQDQKNFVDLTTENTKARVEAAVKSAAAIASIASAATAAQNSLAQISNNTNQ
jgi:hypothetical protein